MSSISFFANTPVDCPVCESSFKQEVLRTGRGRIIAGDLLSDLRRSYKPSPKYGIVNPLIYNIVVCPQCLYATMPDDFKKVRAEFIPQIRETEENRKKYVKTIFDEEVDYQSSRTVLSGAASMFLAVSTYSCFPKDLSPTVRKAVCALRSSWLCRDLIADHPDRNFAAVYWYFRRLAWKLYERFIRYAETGEEAFDNMKKLGPDVDTDYGYDGALYIMSYLGYELKDFMDEYSKYQKFSYYRNALSKVFGFGKSSKEKPSNILEIARELHEKMGNITIPLKKKYGKAKDPALGGEADDETDEADDEIVEAVDVK